jgi:hypothetical protein
MGDRGGSTVANAKIKTTVNDQNVVDFLSRVPNPTRREDAATVLRLMKAVTRKTPRMWGPSIVGFDQYHYKYDSGREGDICMIGFSPRAQALTIYIMPGFDSYKGLIKKLGRCTTSVSCLYIRKLSDVDLDVLRQLMTDAYRHMKTTHGGTRRGVT